ncbi:MAG TPA: DUF4097 family beta strand repeat-containing protein [Pyrinomonadaceae bacterium]|nr:DUF4097 family beta strand repeat-containing protein [Pyrinomonadaceae bacterium]
MMRRILMGAALLCLAASAALAQSDRSRYSLSCRDQGNSYGDGSRARHCEVKEQTLPGGGALDVDASQNGGISVKGWERNDVLVRYRVQTQARTQAEADNLASQIQLGTAGGQIRATGPEPRGNAHWDVSFEIFVPRQSSLALRTHNGGISVSDVHGRVQFDATNGGVALKRLGGSVSGETVNGGLAVELTGNNWDGEGLDVKTTNGGLSVSIPENYSAHLETGTVNGGLDISPSIAQVTRETKRLSLDLGGGGTNLRIHTTNGGVSIKRGGRGREM